MSGSEARVFPFVVEWKDDWNLLGPVKRKTLPGKASQSRNEKTHVLHTNMEAELQVRPDTGP